MTGDPGPRQRKPASVRRREILDAATEEFAAGGLAGSRIESIAARAEISHPRVVQMFGTKQNLFLESVGSVFDEVSRTFEATPTSRDGELALTLLGESYLRMLHARPSLGTVMLQAYAASADADVRAVVRERVERLGELVMRLTGADVDQMRAFLATGLSLTVTAILELEGPDESVAWGTWLIARTSQPDHHPRER